MTKKALSRAGLKQAPLGAKQKTYPANCLFRKFVQILMKEKKKVHHKGAHWM